MYQIAKILGNNRPGVEGNTPQGGVIEGNAADDALRGIRIAQFTTVF
jgi:hypothetical protein